MKRLVGLGAILWVPAKIDRTQELDQVSCVSTSFCVAVDGGDVVVGTPQLSDGSDPPEVVAATLLDAA